MPFWNEMTGGRVDDLFRAAAAFFAAHAKKEKAQAAAIEAAEEARKAAGEAAANAPAPPPPIFRDRATLIAQSDLGSSLTGSYFMFKDMGEVQMIGLVLHEVQAPIQPDAAYLLQLYDGVLGDKIKQLIVPQSRMLYGHVSEDADRMGLHGMSEWSFYDKDEELTQAWHEYCLGKEREGVPTAT